MTMSRDHYEVLGVPENANETWIRRAFQTAQDRIAADAGLSDKDRQEELRALESALRTLTSAPAREAYDEKLRRAREAQARAEAGIVAQLKSPKAWITLALVAAIGGGWYWQYSREQDRLRIEREQITAEQAEKRRIAEAEERRLREKQRLQEEIRAQKEAEENQHKLSLEATQADLQKKQFAVDDRIPALQQQSNYYADRVDALRRQSEDQRQRYEEEAALRRAQAEVDRQKRYLEQREREEAYERARKDPSNNSGYRRY